MPRDISGNYTLPAGNPVVTSTAIATTWANPTMADIALQLNNVMTLDGLLAPTAAQRFFAGTVLLPGVAFATSPSTGMYLPAASTLALTTGGLERFRIDSSGYVGMGTNGPVVRLHLSQSSAGNTLQLLRVENSAVGASTKAQLGFYTAGGTAYGYINGGYGASAPEMDFVLPAATPGNFTWSSNSIERLRLDSGGNLLAGVATPIYPSANRVSVEVNGTTQALFGMGVGGTAATYLLHDGTDLTLNQQRAGALVLSTNNTERVRIDASGNMGVGTTSPTDALHIKKTTPVLNLNSTGNIGTGAAAYVKFLADAGTAECGYFGFGGGAAQLDVWNRLSGALVFGTNNLERMRIDSSGNVGVGTASPAAKFDVFGTSNLSLLSVGDEAGAAFLSSLNRNSSTNQWFVAHNLSDVVTGNSRVDAGGYKIATANTSRLSISITGNVAVAQPTSGVPLTLNHLTGQAVISVLGTAAASVLALQASGSTTGAVYSDYQNTTGYLRTGVESSAGGTLVSGAAAYASVLASMSATSLVLGTNSGSRLVINSGGNVTIAAPSSGQGLVVTAAASERAATFVGAFGSLVTTVAGLSGGAVAVAGSRAFVSDANATTFASIVAGGGSNNVPVYHDGTNWRIG